MRGENVAFMGQSPYAESDDPLKYLKKNVLAIGTILDANLSSPGFNVSLKSWEGDFDIVAEKYLKGMGFKGTVKVVDKDGTETKGIFGQMVRLADRSKVTDDGGGSGSSHAIKAYYVGWARGMVMTRDIGNDYKMCFTPQLSGCTFVAVGNDRGAMTVAHYNKNASPEDKGDKALFERMKVPIKDMFSSQDAIEADIEKRGWKNKTQKFCFHPGLYSGEDDLATIIGLRRNKEWTFYYQRYAREEGKGHYRIIDVGEIPALK